MLSKVYRMFIICCLTPGLTSVVTFDPRSTSLLSAAMRRVFLPQLPGPPPGGAAKHMNNVLIT